MNNRMSEGYRDTVKTANGKYLLVDSRDTFDHGYETMVFRCDENGAVDNWLDIDVDTYPTLPDMIKGHVQMINKWKERCI